MSNTPDFEESAPPGTAPAENQGKTQDEKLEHLKDEQLSFQIDSIDKEVDEKLNDKEKKMMAVISKEISKHGLTVREACELANLPYDALMEMYEKKPVVKKIIEQKKLEYKRQIKKTLSAAIRKGDDDKAMEMAEKLFPEEFGNDANSEEQEETLLREAIEFAREHSDKTMLVSERDSRPHGKDGEMPDSAKREDMDYEAAIENALA